MKKDIYEIRKCLFIEDGIFLPSQFVAKLVLSTLRSLTSVFGMRTGGPPRHQHRHGIITSFHLELSIKF